MFGKSYYALVAGLREYALDAETKGFDLEAIIAEILEVVSDADAKRVNLLYAYYDCENLISRYNGSSTHNPLGRLSSDEVKEELQNPSRLIAPLAKVVAAYASQNKSCLDLHIDTPLFSCHCIVRHARRLVLHVATKSPEGKTVYKLIQQGKRFVNRFAVGRKVNLRKQTHGGVFGRDLFNLVCLAALQEAHPAERTSTIFTVALFTVPRCTIGNYAFFGYANNGLVSVHHADTLTEILSPESYVGGFSNTASRCKGIALSIAIDQRGVQQERIVLPKAIGYFSVQTNGFGIGLARFLLGR